MDDAVFESSSIVPIMIVEQMIFHLPMKFYAFINASRSFEMYATIRMPVKVARKVEDRHERDITVVERWKLMKTLFTEPQGYFSPKKLKFLKRKSEIRPNFQEDTVNLFAHEHNVSGRCDWHTLSIKLEFNWGQDTDDRLGFGLGDDTKSRRSVIGSLENNIAEVVQLIDIRIWTDCSDICWYSAWTLH